LPYGERHLSIKFGIKYWIFFGRCSYVKRKTVERKRMIAGLPTASADTKRRAIVCVFFVISMVGYR